MEERRLFAIGVLLTTALVIAGALAPKVLTWPSHESLMPIAALHGRAISALVVPARQSRVPAAGLALDDTGGSQSNVLQLPQVSIDFVGAWGGYTCTTIRSVIPDLLAGDNPDRVSVVFGRQGQIVFVAAELYGGPHQRIARKPRVRTASSREVVIEYESEDVALYYVYTNRFTLRGSGQIAYQEYVSVFDRTTHNLTGAVSQRATLRRLLTTEELRRFSRPSLYQVPKRSITAKTDLAPEQF